MSERMLDLLRDLPAALGDLGHGDPDQPGRVLAADVVRWAAAEIARLREERRWVPVGERLPELNDENHFQFNCLVYCGNGHVCEMIYEINTYAKQERHRQPRWKWHGMISMWDITHWQPLPPWTDTKGVGE